MQKFSFFSEAADYLSLISNDYQYGIPDSTNEVVLIRDYKNGITLSGSEQSELLFVTCSKFNSINEFLESKDGVILANLIKNGLKSNTKDFAFMLITSKVGELNDSYLAEIKTIKKVVFFGEEFSLIENTFKVEDISFFNTYSLQEIRNSKSVKKDFWSKFKVFYER